MKKPISLFFFALCAATAGAQGIDTVTVHQLQEVQVVSTRARKTTPVPFSEMQQIDIQAVNHGKDVPQMLLSMPSVTASSDAGAGVGYTGIHVRGTDPTRINVTANGIPLNDSESAQLYWVNMGDLASSIQSLQLQRGVGTSTNGAGAFGASLNMLTENIGKKSYLDLNLAAGSYGTTKATARFSSGLLANHWGVQGRLSTISSDGYISRASSRLGSYFLQAAYFGRQDMLKIITFGGREKTYMAWDYVSKADMATFGCRYNPSGMYTDDNGNTAFYHNQTDNYAQLHNQFHWIHQFNKQWNLNLAAHYTYGNGHYEQYKTNQKLYKYHLADPQSSDRSDLVRQKKMKNHFYGTVFSLNYDNGNRLTMNFGGALNKYDGDHYGNVIWLRDFDGECPAHNHYYDNNARKTDANIYGKVNYELLPGLHAFVDMQYRYIDYSMSGLSQEFDDDKVQRPLVLDRHYNFFNPKAGLSYKFLNHHLLFASYAVAHKEPTRNDFEDMLAETDEVDPSQERLNDIEIGYTYHSKRFEASLNFFYMDYDNQFVLTGAQDSNGEMVARNIKDTYRAGLEMEATWQPIEGLRWSANATWSKNRAKNMMLTVINDDWSQAYVNAGTTNLAYSPDWVVGNILSYEKNGWKATAFTKYVGKQYMTNSGFKRYLNTDGETYTSAMIDAFCTTDLDLNYTFQLGKIKALTVGATVYNIFSSKYESNGSCSMNYRMNQGKLEAYDGGWAWSVYSAQAPIHFMCYLNISL